jgi:hypothetical protein
MPHAVITRIPPDAQTVRPADLDESHRARRRHERARLPRRTCVVPGLLSVGSVMDFLIDHFGGQGIDARKPLILSR